MEFLSNIYDKVLSGYVSTDVFKYKTWQEGVLGKDRSSCNGQGNDNDTDGVKRKLEEILGTFVKNGKISHALWAQHKMFIGDEGIYILGEVITICQIVEFVDADDLVEINSNEEFKANILEELKRRLNIKRKTEMLEEKIITNISMCNSNFDDEDGNNDDNEGDADGDWAGGGRGFDKADRVDKKRRKKKKEGSNKDNESSYNDSSYNDSSCNDNDRDDSNLGDKNAVSNFVEMLCAGKTNKFGFCEYDQKFNDRYNLKNSKNDRKSSKSLEHCILPFREDYEHKYVCLLLNHSGKQEARILRFSRNCESTNKLLDTLKGTVTFLNELRFLFKFFRSQVVLKDRIYGEFCAYIKFHRSDPNFSGTKAMNEFFNSLNDSALKQLFFGLNEQNLNLLEEAISYCPIATFSFFKNIKLLKKINVNATRRTWKAVCGLQRLYKNLKKVREKMALDDPRLVCEEYSSSCVGSSGNLDAYRNGNSNANGSRDEGIHNQEDYHQEDYHRGNRQSNSHTYSSSSEHVRLAHAQGNNSHPYETELLHSKERELAFKSSSSSVHAGGTGGSAVASSTACTSTCSVSCTVNNCNHSSGHVSSGIVGLGNKKNKSDLFTDKSESKEYHHQMFSNSLDLHTEEKKNKNIELNKLNDTCLYVTSDEENLQMARTNNITGELNCANRTIEENNKTLLDQTNKMFMDDNYRTADEMGRRLSENRLMRENSLDDVRANMIKLFKTYGGQCRIGKVQGRCEDATFQTDIPPAFGIFDGVGSWSLEGIDASKFSIGLSLACQREAEKLSKNLNDYAKVSYNTIIRSKLLLRNSLESVKKEYADAYGSSTAIVGLIDEYTGKCGIASLGDSVCMILRREFLPGDINFERETYPKFPVESFLYYNNKGRNPSIVRKIIWKTSEQKWENGAPYQLSNLPDRSQWKDLENRGLHSFVKILEKVDIDGDPPEAAVSPPSEILCMPGDLILLMSDGVSDNLFDEEIEAYCTFAISPEEACELGDPSAFTPAQDIAYSITNIAKRRSGDKLHSKPFFPFLGKYREPNRTYKGNKVDDISCVAIWVVCETEDSVKNFVANPDEPSILETDKYYSNNYFQHFNKITDICTPTKKFIKEKNRIERVNLQHINMDSGGLSGEGETAHGKFGHSNSSNMNAHFSANFFDSSETPIKFSLSDDNKYQDLSDIVLKDEDDASSADADNSYGGDSHGDSHGDHSGDEEVTLPRDNPNEVDSNKLSDDMDSMKTPNSNSLKARFKDQIFNRDDFDHTPRQRISDDRLDEHIERINNMYIKTPILHIDKNIKTNKTSVRKTKVSNKGKGMSNKKMEQGDTSSMLNYETPKKQMIMRSGTREKGNVVTSINENAVMNSFINNETPVKSSVSKDTSLKVDKKITKNKRKSVFNFDKNESPSKISYSKKRSKKS
ncbi:conserved Plasmodium protein, unknown function [Plasmodium knowlesi strain H]|uniref:PPM-type phosphatase domain-containing protein n=3 Tax=Plasmodium knowlesi TaxID=5850 RepID=A0A5E7X4X1_PLAKH|nr:protein phosphatase PPM11, putative [Plasmodium knowlesi strain H]OTN66857.1 Uncharacterized protein PKNOH_S08480300 [Plasmodium knowlesi]CAA9990127.1 protein phosphatase PPM11, putative [Plasmodium knowlesi strain H]SBO25810.1 conserved Plasmodium protein, unknown function [Plasmodium knowlesi strain H]SBO28600.1 conserved Plasmodium protein, unknown function [Plasmodium knowlesi strain H]VVS79601.1 protein phosphatase PPM11, putative [Plasmodium knowlesi strain H]